MAKVLAGHEKRLLRIASVPMAILALSCVYPILFAANNALKSDKNYILDRFSLVKDPTFANFINAWSRAHLADYLFNSVIATAGAVLLLLLFSSLAGYALAMLRFRLRRVLFTLVLATMMIPVQVVMVPSIAR